MSNFITRYGRLLLILAAKCIYSQPLPPFLTLPNFGQPQSGVKFIQQRDGHLSSVMVMRDGQTRTDDIDLTEMMDIIVEFKEEPLAIQQLSHPHTLPKPAFFAARFTQFAGDLRRIQQSQPQQLRTVLAQPDIEREFYKIFYGASVKVPRIALQQIQHLDYAKKIHWNEDVHAWLDESVSLIRADSVWRQYGTQGENVVVGILDTGINYKHPALGSGIGANFKVIGGYDVINNDSDPMDDNGHGTYVAGIVAANGDSIKGVAPKARLMAFKVLNQYGSARDSDIIAGIERAIDPNNDNNFADKVDIANMSLGGEGNPDDAVSNAVDNAVKLGVTFCISAGNEARFNTIGSPGTARLAITVGASDKKDKMAFFSSKGPNAKIYSIKPEIVAPGVDIRSLDYRGGFLKASGTSAAAPHVAGVCALLSAIHPQWNPAQIKSALITSAVDLGEETMVQGAGRVDALKAAQTSVFAVPAQLSFGLDDLTQTEWTKAETLMIVNQSSVTQQFNLGFEGLRTGIQLTAAPSSFMLSHDDSQSVEVTLNVKNALLPFPREGSLAYAGNFLINGTKDKLRLPWALVKAAKIMLTFDEPEARFGFGNDKMAFFDFQGERVDPYTYEFVLPAGRYDLLAMFVGDEGKLVVKENLDIGGFMYLPISFQEATHTLMMNGVDEKGRLLSTLDKAQRSHLFVFPDSSRFRFWLFSGFLKPLRISEVSERFAIATGEAQGDIENDRRIRVVQHKTIRGLRTDVTLANVPSDFIRQRLNIKFPAVGDYRELDVGSGFSLIVRGSAMIGVFGEITQSVRVATREWNGELYHTPNTSGDYRFSGGASARDEALAGSSPAGDWFIPRPFNVIGDSLASFFPYRTRDIYISPNGGEMSFGGAPIYGIGWQQNNIYGKSNIFSFVRFFGSLNEVRFADVSRVRYAIYDEWNTLIATDLYEESQPIDVAAGRYRMEVNHKNYFVEGTRGAATLTTFFDLGQNDANPPRLTSLKLLNAKGVPVGKVATGESAELVFSATDVFYTKDDNDRDVLAYRAIAADSTRIYFKQNDTSAWREVKANQVVEDTAYAYLDLAIGHLYTVDLAPATQFDSTAIDLKIKFQDQSGNVTDWTLEPAFAVGKFGTLVSVADQANKKFSLPQTYALYQNYPNPFWGETASHLVAVAASRGAGNPETVIAFDLPKTDNMTLKIFDVLGREVATLLDQIVEAGGHKVIWNGANENRASLPSGVYFYQMHAGDFVATKKLLLLR